MRGMFTHKLSTQRRGHSDGVFSHIAMGFLALMLVACNGTTTTTSVPPTTGIPPATSAPSTAATPPTAPSITTSSAPLGTVTLTPEGPFEGYHERNTCMVIGGWVYDTSKPDTPISVEIFDGASLLATLVADIFRADLRDAGKGNGNHSFTFIPPASLKDGKAHQILVRIAGTNIGLRGTPMSLTCMT